MKETSPSREELFAMVWECPAKEVARELGISDVALGKMCRKLQVPKPPRGYWAKMAAGRKPRQPPLRAYREEKDQPEDNPDNVCIVGRIVHKLHAAKTERQFLFAAHNANIPVFADARWIGVYSASEGFDY